jgi:dihydropyrimidinase
MSILIKGGRIVTAADDYIADVYIEHEQVTLIGESLDVQADRVIDAYGKCVLPGGIDPHTHMDSVPLGGTKSCDNFTDGTISGAFGGVTTIVDFCFQQRGQDFAHALDIWHGKLEQGKPVIDVGFHLVVTDLKEGGSVEDLASLPDQGVTSYKLFMAFKGALMIDDETLFKSMQVAAESGSIVMVHAENGDVIDILIKKALAAGNTSPAYHALTRPPELEGEATNRAIQLARVAGCPVYVVHVSCEDAIGPIARAREVGWKVWGETCSQYLMIDHSYLDRPGFEGAKYVYTPPPRESHHLSALWEALRTDTLSVVSTDHAPFNFRGQKDLVKDDFSKIPNGSPGIEERLKILHTYGVRAGRFDMNRLVQLWATNPAKLFGLYPRKGTIAIGSDADIVVFDPERKATLSVSGHHSTCDYNLYEGLEVAGSPETVLVRGTVVVHNDELQVQAGHGQFIKRARFEERLAPAKAAV